MLKLSQLLAHTYPGQCSCGQESQHSLPWGSCLAGPPERLVFPHTGFHTFHCLSPIHFFPPTAFHPMELSKKEYWEGHWRNEVVTAGSTEGPSGNMSNADTLLLSWAEPALPTWRSEHKQGHELLKPSPANQGVGCISQQLLPRQVEKEESQLGFLCSSELPSVACQGQSMAAVPQGCPTWAPIVHYSCGSFRIAPLGMEWQETCAGETPHQGSWAYSHK